MAGIVESSGLIWKGYERLTKEEPRSKEVAWKEDFKKRERSFGGLLPVWEQREGPSLKWQRTWTGGSTSALEAWRSIQGRQSVTQGGNLAVWDRVWKGQAGA